MAGPSAAGAVYPMGDEMALATAVEGLLPRLQTPELTQALHAFSASHSCEAAVAGTVDAVQHLLNG